MLKITYLGWANFIVESEARSICFDPFFKTDKKMDLILASHAHPDHCDLEVIKEIKKENAKVVTNEEAGKNIIDSEIIKAGESKEINGIKVLAVEGYNLKIPNHQKGKDLGFIVEIQGKRIYHAGDTDLIEEMKQIKNIDLALLPVGGTYTMDVDQGVEAVKLIQPKIIIPMHYGKIKLGGQKFELKADIDDFKNKVEQETKTKVVVLSPGQEYVLN